jgi:hypothetical protein
VDSFIDAVTGVVKHVSISILTTRCEKVSGNRRHAVLVLNGSPYSPSTNIPGKEARVYGIDERDHNGRLALASGGSFR